MMGSYDLGKYHGSDNSVTKCEFSIFLVIYSPFVAVVSIFEPFDPVICPTRYARKY